MTHRNIMIKTSLLLPLMVISFRFVASAQATFFCGNYQISELTEKGSKKIRSGKEYLIVGFDNDYSKIKLLSLKRHEIITVSEVRKKDEEDYYTTLYGGTNVSGVPYAVFLSISKEGGEDMIILRYQKKGNTYISVHGIINSEIKITK